MNKTIHSIFPLLVSSLLFNTTNAVAEPLVGILYSTLHCSSSEEIVGPEGIHDISKILASHRTNSNHTWEEDGGAVATPQNPNPPPHWWGRPSGGYYCLSSNVDLLQRHATQLVAAGIDFIMFDMTNHPHNLSPGFHTDMALPFAKLLSVWSKMGDGNAPKVIPWVRVYNTFNRDDLGNNDPFNKSTVYNQFIAEQPRHTIDMLLKNYNSDNKDFEKMAYILNGKPVVFVSPQKLPHDSTEAEYADTKIEALGGPDGPFQIQRMWTGLIKTISNQQWTSVAPSAVPQDWNYLTPCQPNFDGYGPCDQAATKIPGRFSHISVSAAYQIGHMSNPNTAVPKLDGRTLIQQFRTAALSNVNVVTINDWNSWVVLRVPVVGEIHQFTDSYDIEYNRDLEPGGTLEPGSARENYYYNLLKRAVPLLKAGDHNALQGIINEINDTTRGRNTPAGYSYIAPY